MAQCLIVNNLIIQVFICSVIVNEISPYDKILVENAKLCSLKDDKLVSTVRLEKVELSSKIITQNKYFNKWSGRYVFSCSFQVKAPEQYGVYAVIQVLDFRKNESTGLCKDYVEFEIPPNFFQFFKKQEKISKKFCGKILASENHLSNAKDIEHGHILKYSAVADNGFVAKGGVIRVTIHIARERLEPDEKLDINIAFTSYKQDCKAIAKSVQCSECEWIWEGLRLDKIQNCPYTSCLDESFCRDLNATNEIRNVISVETGTKVSIGAVSTIILVLLLFGSFVWMSRRLQLFCFHPPANSQPRIEMNTTQRNSRLEENLTPYGDTLRDSEYPSAPPISEDKDLPPSYSSLFP